MEKIYKADECVVFRKTHEAFGGLSNMAAGYMVRVSDYHFDSSEHLYQMCRFPDYSDIQREIGNESNPMKAKMFSKKYRKEFTRMDWLDVREDIMWWCLRLKLAANREKFGALLESTGNKMIVEDSRADRFWGAVRNKQNSEFLEGENRLGKLLVKLREFYRGSDLEQIETVETPAIENFKLFGYEIENYNHTQSMKKFYARLAVERELALNLF
jgi:ribA/ribD-fused uncharacterized protein